MVEANIKSGLQLTYPATVYKFMLMVEVNIKSSKQLSQHNL